MISPVKRALSIPRRRCTWSIPFVSCNPLPHIVPAVGLQLRPIFGRASMIETLQNALLNLISRPLAAVGLCLLLLLGLATLASKILAVIEFVNIYFLRPGKNLRRLGDWAAITGATDGIGKAYAEALAKKGDPQPRSLDPARCSSVQALPLPMPTPPGQPRAGCCCCPPHTLCASAPGACVACRHTRCKGPQTALTARRLWSRAGFNVILVSRTESKLTAVATDLEARYGVQTKVVPADFAAMEDATWNAVAAVLGSVPLGVLINSAGRLLLHVSSFLGSP